MRVWFLKQADAIYIESSVGANTTVWSREGVIYRLTPRRNDAVNDTWMPDSGRMLYKQVQAAERLKQITVNGTVANLAAATSAAAELLKAGAVAVVGSGRSTVEEQLATKRLVAAIGATAHLVSSTAEGDGLLISADRNPNVRGALLSGLIDTLPTAQLTALAAAIAAGKVKTVVSIGEDLTAAGLTAAQLAQVAVIYLGTHANATSAVARVVLPTLTVFEKSGTFVNQQFRLQKSAAAVPGLAGASDYLVVLDRLVIAAGGNSAGATVGAVWTALSAEIAQLTTVTFANLSKQGLLLDGSAWASLPFVEGETLHYKPAAAASVAQATA